MVFTIEGSEEEVPALRAALGAVAGVKSCAVLSRVGPEPHVATLLTPSASNGVVQSPPRRTTATAATAAFMFAVLTALSAASGLPWAEAMLIPSAAGVAAITSLLQ